MEIYHHSECVDIYCILAIYKRLGYYFFHPVRKGGHYSRAVLFESGVYFFKRSQSHWHDNALVHLHARAEVLHQCGGILLQCGVYFCCFQHHYLYFPLHIAQLLV